jgi:Ser/Thr protein kinase RdoA (MazF antagonist)
LTLIDPPSWGLSQASLLDLCQAWFQESVTIRQLYGDSDQNVLVTRPDGQQCVLKIRAENSAQAIDFIEMQVAVLGHLDGGKHAVRTPRPIATRDGQWWLRVEGENQALHLAWMLTFIPGDLLDQVSHYSDALLLDIGRSVAVIDRALLDFHDTRTERKQKWDLAWVLELTGYQESVDDSNRQSLLKNFFERISHNVMPRLAACPQSVIHNDGGNQHNMIVKQPDAVIGIIDFGDVVLTQRICGLGIAAAYACFGHADPAHAIGLTAAGYHQVLPLSPDEQALVPDLAATRLAMSVAISSQRAQLEDDPYITVSAEPAWRVLSQIDTFSEDKMALLVKQYLECTDDYSR